MSEPKVKRHPWTAIGSRAECRAIEQADGSATIEWRKQGNGSAKRAAYKKNYKPHPSVSGDMLEEVSDDSAQAE